MAQIDEGSTESRARLFQTLAKLAMLKREPVDTPYLRSCIEQIEGATTADTIPKLMHELSVAKPKKLQKADEAYCPLLGVDDQSVIIVTGRKPDGSWSYLEFDLEKRDFVERETVEFTSGSHFFRVSFQQKFAANRSPSLRLIVAEILQERRLLADLIAATFLISIVALVSSIYSMQVYDRVVPTGAFATLYVLTLGALVAALLDAIAKWIRSHQITGIADRVDQRLARSVFSRFLGVRLDVMPTSVGAMAQRLRSYEGVRSFLLTSMTSVVVDIPLALMLAVVLYAIGGYLVLIPASFFLVGVIAAVLSAKKIEYLAKSSLPAHNQKTGHLVESVEGAEIIKTGNGGWRMLAKWLDLSDRARVLDREMKDASENFQFVVGFFQQVSYTALIAFGAYAVATGKVTVGGLIACSILSGRILSPLAALPNMVVQWANTKASLQDLDRFWRLQQDIEEGSQSIYTSSVRGEFELQSVGVEYSGVRVLNIDSLKIRAGETVAILGAVGSGKTTLLRSLTGLYKPQVGRVLLDGMNISEMDRTTLSQQVAFVPQDGRLFSGSLRDNLLIGLIDPGDEVCIDVAKRTGLYQSVIAPHPKGLSREILEGGFGLSGGQRQLVHITRAMLRNPAVWLLDEPTASMDGQTEEQVIQALRHARNGDQSSTFVFVTHKPQIVALASRVIVLAQGRIALDGPRDAVLKKLQSGPQHGANRPETVQ